MKNVTIKPLQLIILFTLLQLFIGLLTDGFCLSFDESIWHYIGRNWFRNGLPPYSGGIDNKSPLIFSIFGFSDLLFGVNYWFPRMLGTIFQSIGILYVFRIANHFAGRQAGIVAMTLYGLSLLWSHTGGKDVSYTESYSVAFVIVAIYKFLTAKTGKDFLLGGLIGGVGFAFRYSSLLALLAIFFSLAKNKKRGLIPFALGFLISLTFLFGIAYFSGINIRDLIFHSLTDNFSRGSVTDHPLLWKLESFLSAFFYSEFVLFYPGLIAYFFIKKRIDFFALWLICAFIGISIIGLYATTHLKELLPALSLINAFAICHLVKNYRLPLRPVMITIWILFFPKVLEPLVSLKKIFISPVEDPEKLCRNPAQPASDGNDKKLGLWIRDNTNQKDLVFVAGFGARAQVYTERLSPTVYFNVTQTPRAKQRFFRDIAKNRPTIIAVPILVSYERNVNDDMRSFIQQLVEKEYAYIRCMYGYAIYRIKG